MHVWPVRPYPGGFGCSFKAVVLLLLIHCVFCLLLLPLVVGVLFLVPFFVMQYLVSFLVFQSSGYGRDKPGNFALFFIVAVLWLLVARVSSSRIIGLICSV